MIPVTQLSALDMMAELEHLEQVRGNARLAPESAARHNALMVELGRRVKCLDESTEDWRKLMVEAFARSASVAVCGLWQAHRGRELTAEEAARFARVMHDFFVTIK